jgi:hypothetical protein
MTGSADGVSTLRAKLQRTSHLFGLKLLLPELFSAISAKLVIIALLRRSALRLMRRHSVGCGGEPSLRAWTSCSRGTRTPAPCGFPV